MGTGKNYPNIYQARKEISIKCNICEINCTIKEKGLGQCGMYTCSGSKIQERYPDRYLAAVDTAIESMPMVHYQPRGIFLQVCTVGCNFKCQGCVSKILTDHLGAIEGQFQEMTPEEVIQKALSLNCIGVIFCFNEPTVSYFTFKRLAKMARGKRAAGRVFNQWLYDPMGPGRIDPPPGFCKSGTQRNEAQAPMKIAGSRTLPRYCETVKLLHQNKVYFEISAIFRKHQEEELKKAGEFIAVPFKKNSLPGHALHPLWKGNNRYGTQCHGGGNRLRAVARYTGPRISFQYPWNRLSQQLLSELRRQQSWSGDFSAPCVPTFSGTFPRVAVFADFNCRSKEKSMTTRSVRPDISVDTGPSMLWTWFNPC